MKIKRPVIIVLSILVIYGIWFFISKHNKNNAKASAVEEVRPDRGMIEVAISTTGTVQPQNRLEVKPPINGRIEEIPVKEGDLVKKGDVLAWMSSTDRAALLDAARSKGEESIKYWEEVYKSTSLIAPIDGEVIVRSVEPGQTVSSSDPVVVLSDRLIVKAQVDETDVGGVVLGQKAIVSLDAYPSQQVQGKVDHIAYESKVVSNVTIYEVDIVLDEIPGIFKSGMSANIEIVKDSRENVLRLPLKAVKREEKGEFVLVKEEGSKKYARQRIETGLSDDKFIEIKSGIAEGDVVVIEQEKGYIPKKGKQANSPFMPSRPQGNRGR